VKTKTVKWGKLLILSFYIEMVLIIYFELVLDFKIQGAILEIK